MSARRYGPGGNRRAQLGQHVRLVHALANQIGLLDLALRPELGELHEHELEIFEQRAHARVVAGGRIEHQLSGGQQVPRLRGKASGVAGIGPRIGAKRRQQRFRPREVLRRRHLIGEVARRIVHRGERGDGRRTARLLNVTNIPSTILIDKSGRLVSRMDGFDPATFLEQMTERIQTILAAPAK